jgi:glycosyltransferase involved in cell wall biosynthesis
MKSIEHTKSPLISIIIAVYNGSATLQRCLDSIACQTHNSFELIVMDGGSTDGTLGILEDNAHIISLWRSERDRGIYHAWNKALDVARGEWVLFLGADDRLAGPMVLGNVAQLLEASKQHSLVYGKIVFEGGKMDGLVLGKEWSWKKFRRQMSIPHTGAFHHRQLFKELGNFKEDFPIAGDYELLLRARDGLNPRFIDYGVTIMAADGTSSRNRLKSLKEARRAQMENKVASALYINFWHLYYTLLVKLDG